MPFQPAPGDADQVPRKQRFQAAHPDVQILLRGYWEAVIPAGAITGGGEQVVRRYHLSRLLDALEDMLPPGPAGGQ